LPASPSSASAPSRSSLERALFALFALFLLFCVATFPGARLVARMDVLLPPPLPPGDEERDAALAVRVTDEAGAALAGATVRVLVVRSGDQVFLGGEAVSDGAGTATLKRLPRGEAWVLADAPGFARGSTSLVLVPAAGEPRIVELRLGPEHGFDVEVRTTTGDPVPLASIEVQTGEPLGVGARTDLWGRAHVGRLPKGPWVVHATAAGYDVATDRGVRDDAAIVLVLHRLGAITVTVVRAGTAGDEPVQNARVLIAGTALGVPREGRTGATGRVKLAGLFAGTFALRAVLGAEVSDVELAVSLAAGEEKELTLRLGPGRSVPVLVVDDDGDDADPVGGARVVLAEGGVSPFPVEAVTGRDGRALLGPIAPGPATLTAFAEDHLGRGATPVPEPLDGPVRLVLPRAGRLHGVVTDARGYPVASATLQVLGTDFAGGPIEDDPRTRSFRTAQFEQRLSGPVPLQPAGDLGVVPGPVPPIPRGPVVIPGPVTGSTGPPPEPWVTRGDGSFVLAPVTPGRVRVLVRHPEYVEAFSATVTLAPGGDAEVNVVLHGGGSLEGRVLDAAGRPVAGARVELAATRGREERSARTASDGTFAFAAVPDAIVVSVYRGDDDLVPSVRAAFDVPENERKTVTLTLPAQRDPIAVHVKDDRGYPIATAQVGAVSVDAAQPARATAFTDDRGDATLAGLRGLSVRLEVRAPGHAPRALALEDGRAEVEVKLERALVVRGFVRSARGGTPLDGIEVTLASDLGPRLARTDAQGRFAIDEVAAGPTELRLRGAGWAPLAKPLVLDAKGKDEIDLGTLELAEEAIAEGVVVDGRGDPVPFARVAVGFVPVYLAQGAPPPGVAVANAKGRFHLGGVAAGLVSLAAYAPDVGRGHVDVELRVGRPADVKIVLAPVTASAVTPGGAGSVAVTLGDRAATKEVVVVAVAAGSEAERAGVRSGDVIAKVDGVVVGTIEEARAKLDGPLADDVVLELRRGDASLRLRIAREAVLR
jgi:hypothetical protein